MNLRTQIDMDCARLIHYIYNNFESDNIFSLKTIDTFEVKYILQARPHGIFAGKEVFGLVLYEKERNIIIVAFRGTNTFHDWLSNIDVEQNEYGIHKGFYDIYKQMKPELICSVLNILKTYPNAKVYITGHSLGGALATIAGYKIDSEVITFASPRVGSPEFAVKMNNKTNIIRYVNTEDVVPTIPLAVIDEDEILYEHCGKPICFTKNIGSVEGNHSLELYRSYVEEI